MNRPTAIFAASDTQAVGVLSAADATGLRVPGDLSVIGFDDIDTAAQWSLSTVRQPLRESGTRGAVRLCQLLRGEAVRPLREVLPLELIIRGSPRPPAVAGRRTGLHPHGPNRPDPGPGRPRAGPVNGMTRRRESTMTVVSATRRGRRRLLLITLVATSALTLAACGSSGSSSSSSGGSSSQPTGSATSGSITWWASPITTSSPDPLPC